jgi:hypothetical protein
VETLRVLIKMMASLGSLGSEDEDVSIIDWNETFMVQDGFGLPRE